jgi:NAD(P)-dependent dehydrogenase (short-subunit alcohol dehydrogenase family)
MSANNSFNLHGMRALVTGGAYGIGLAITQALVAHGAKVHICGTKAQALSDAQAAHPTIHTSVTDITREADVLAMFRTIATQWGGLDILINNAGIAGPTAAIDDITLADWQQCMDVNLTGTFLCTRGAAKSMKQQRSGSIINIGSVASRLGFPQRSPYSATKYGVIGLTETWATELGPHGIRVNAVLPGIVEGPRQDRVLAASAETASVTVEQMRERVLQRVSLRKMVTADDIAAAVVFLCSPAGASITGQSLSVDGNVETLVR